MYDTLTILNVGIFLVNPYQHWTKKGVEVEVVS